MPLTRSFNETIRERATRDPAFRAALFSEAVQALLAGDLDTPRRRCGLTSRQPWASKSWPRPPARPSKA